MKRKQKRTESDSRPSIKAQAKAKTTAKKATGSKQSPKKDDKESDPSKEDVGLKEFEIQSEFQHYSVPFVGYNSQQQFLHQISDWLVVSGGCISIFWRRWQKEGDQSADESS